MRLRFGEAIGDSGRAIAVRAASEHRMVVRGLLRERLQRIGSATFRSLTQDCQHTLEVVARFLALLELYREQAVLFEQDEPLGELHVIWTGADDGDVEVGDDYEGAPEQDGARGARDARDEGDGRDDE